MGPDDVITIPLVHVLTPAVEREEVLPTSVQDLDEVLPAEPVGWTKPFIDWLQDNVLPVDKSEAKVLLAGQGQDVRATGRSIV